ncbi:MAG TPA: helicase-exonuclease AddAB subunit AddA [Tissierellia bacterium]|nr:helicase-exonuclease AddAB subunit AddA [Tissierellia bacterium]
MWTKEQLRIINLKNSNILVSAAAGSGKTTVMVERIINLIKGGEDIDRLLVVTFTRAAAAGMKQKIQKSLIKALQKREGNARHLRRQLSLLNRSMITTIDSFCMDIVRKNFHLLDIDPNFRVGDSSELNILLQEAVDEALEEEYAHIDENENFKKLVEGLTGNRGDEELAEITQNVYKFILSFPDPFSWLDENVDLVNITGDGLKKSKWFDEIINHIGLLLEGAKGFIDTAIEICKEPDGPYLYLDTLAKDREIVDNLIELLNTDLDGFIKALKAFKAPRAASFKEDKYPEVDIDKQGEVNGSKGLRAMYKEIISSIKEFLPYDLDYQKYASEISAMYGTISALRDLIKNTHQKYMEKKKEKSIVDFNDIEHFALSILRTVNEDGEYISSEAAEYYRKKFNYIFIDEYQDTNSLQEAIINQIKRKNNLFMVGDIKQSIYRFRLADPGIFNEKYEEYTPDREDLEDTVIDRTIELNKNFRSRDEILTATNYIFKNIMSKELGEVEYCERVFLNPGKEFSVKTPVELSIIQRNSSEEALNGENEIDEEIESMETAELEAMFAAQKVKELMKEEICTVEGDRRKTEYKDIVILLRSVVGWAGIFEERFNKEDIPFYYDGGKGYYDTVEVSIMVNLLKLIDNVRQDIPLLSVMRSPIGNFSTEELLEIRLKFPKEKHFINAVNKFLALENTGKDTDYSPELMLKLKNFMDKIYSWSYKSSYYRLDDLIWEILMETNYYNFAGALPNSKMRQANLRLLVDLAYDFEKTSMRGLYKFLRYIEKAKKSSDDRGQAKTLGENDNVVRLMSIHKSKGLEFPVVILCGLNKQFNLQDTRNKILLHKDYGIAPMYVNIEDRIERETLARMAIKNKIKKENISEEMRVLYVAMTRAIDKLILAGSVSNMEQKINKWRRGSSKYSVYKGISYMDWICGCLFKNINMEQFYEIMKEGSWKDWNVRSITPYDLSENMNLELNIKEGRLAMMREFKNKINSPHYEKIGSYLSYKYPYRTSVNIPTKLSVTDINNLKDKEFINLRYKIPALEDIPRYNERTENFILDKKVTGAEIGTLLHSVLEHLDLRGNLNKNGIIEKIMEMEKRELLTKDEAEIVVSVYAHRIEEFFRSNIGQRIINSHEVYREAPFVLRKKAPELLSSLNENELILVQGIIDCYFIEEGEAVIVDYKTDTIDESKDVTAQINLLKQEYKDQVTLYKEALERIRGIKVKECYLYFFSIGQEVKI